jgi:ornithine carbamoyltransferase
MWQRFTERARRCVFFAQEEAARLGENYVGTEHLLLGLVRESDSVAARVLGRMDVPLGKIRSDIERQVTKGKGNLGKDMQLTPRAKRAIDLAYEEARQLDNNYIGTEHLLLGLIREGDGLAARVLVKLGAGLERARDVVREMQEGEEQTRPRVPRAEQAPPSGPIGALMRHGGFDSPDEMLKCLDALLAEEVLPLDSHVLEATVKGVKRSVGDLPDLLSIHDLTTQQAELLLALALVLKKSWTQARAEQVGLLRAKTLAMVFEKPSLRTRVTFEAGMTQLGGHAIYLGPADIQLGVREPVADAAHNLERWVDGIVARTFRHETVVELAANARVPVINALSDHEHPCQALADFLAILEKRGTTQDVKVVYVGDGNNVAHSLMLLGARLGAHVVIACPGDYTPHVDVTAESAAVAGATGGSIAIVHDPMEAVRHADVIYTDVWASMGQESEAEERAKVFRPFQVNAALVAAAKPDVLVMHCLPAHRGEEITDEVLDGPNSIVFDQAENRLHAQKALLVTLL